MNEDERLEKLKRGLYSRGGVRLEEEPKQKEEYKEPTVQDDWTYEPPKEPVEKPVQPGKPKRDWLPIILYASLGIFLIAAGTFAYRIFVGGMFSARNVVIEVDAPSTAGAGDSIELAVSVHNRNDAPIHDATLTVVFPEHTYAADESGVVLDRLSRKLGTVAGGDTAEEEFEVFLFGQEGESVEFEVDLEYSTESSSATLTKEEVYEVEIVSSPVTLTVEPMFDEVQSGNKFEIEVEVSSNTNTTLRDLVLTAEYPGGFSLSEANPAPAEDGNVWDIGTLDPRESETITLSGSLEGLDGEERFFIFHVGSEDGENQNGINRLFAESREGVEIIEPPIALSTDINKNSGSTVSVPAGADVNVIISWENTLDDDLFNLVIEAEVDESLIESGSIRADGGFFRSSTDTVVWDRATYSELGNVDAGESDEVSFSFRTKPVDGSLIPITIRAHAEEPQGDISPRSLSNTLTREIHLASGLAATQTLTYRGGPFNNTGPVPPEAGEETTYTVTWEVSSADTAEGVVLRAALPTYVEFIDSSSSAVEVSPLTHEIIWRAGSVRGSRSVSFQVALEASSSQIGGSPLLVREVQVRGEDEFSGEGLSGFAPAITTASLAEQGAGPVVE